MLSAILALVYAAVAQPQAPSSDTTLREVQTLLQNGGLDKASVLIDERLEAYPGDATFLLLKAATLLRKSQYDESRAILEKLLDADSNNVDALLEVGVLDLIQKRFAEAEEPFRKAYTVDPSNLPGLVGIAETYFGRDQPEKAVQVIAEAAQAQPQRADLLEEQAKAELRADHFAKAIADFQSLIDNHRQSPAKLAEIYGGMGNAWSALGDHQHAVENMQKAAQLAPANVYYVSALADFYDRGGRQQEALTAYREALKLSPENGVVLNNLAWVISETGGDLDEALTLAQHARQQLPKSNATLDTIGWIYLKKNLTASAIEVFRELVGTEPDNPTFHYHYAMALAQKEDHAGAMQELKTALQHHPDQNTEKKIKQLIRSLSL